MNIDVVNMSVSYFCQVSQEGDKLVVGAHPLVVALIGMAFIAGLLLGCSCKGGES